MKNCENHIAAYQIMVSIVRSENIEAYNKEFMDSGKIITEALKKEFVEKNLYDTYMVESSKMTINILGKILPYHYDEDKAFDTEMEYTTTIDFYGKECHKIAKDILEPYGIKNFTVYVGEMNFTKYTSES